MSKRPHPYSAPQVVAIINSVMGRDIAKLRPDIAEQNDVVATVSIDDVVFIDLHYAEINTTAVAVHIPAYCAWTEVPIPGDRDTPPDSDIKVFGDATVLAQDAIKYALQGYIANQLQNTMEGMFPPEI